jgi:hypothetical protein
MATIRFDAFSDDAIVLHFGGQGTIDAYTLANALIGFADTACAINATIDPAKKSRSLLKRPVPAATARSFENSRRVSPEVLCVPKTHPS